MGRSQWNWRLFTFVGDYLTNGHDEVAFLKLNEDFARTLPAQELPYSQVAGYWQKGGQPHKALQAIDDGISCLGNRAPRLLFLKTEILLESGRYNEVIETATQALAATAVDQPSASQGAIMFSRANAFDALFFLGINKLPLDPLALTDDALRSMRRELKFLAQSARAGYCTAIETPGTHLIQRSQASTRLRLIADMCKLHGIEIESAANPTTEGKDLSKAQARQLAEHVTEQLKSLSDEEWAQAQEGFIEQLKKDFNPQGITQLAKALMEVASTKPATSERVIQLVHLLKGEPI